MLVSVELVVRAFPPSQCFLSRLRKPPPVLFNQSNHIKAKASRSSDSRRWGGTSVRRPQCWTYKLRLYISVCAQTNILFRMLTLKLTSGSWDADSLSISVDARPSAPSWSVRGGAALGCVCLWATDSSLSGPGVVSVGSSQLSLELRDVLQMRYSPGSGALGSGFGSSVWTLLRTLVSCWNLFWSSACSRLSASFTPTPGNSSLIHLLLFYLKLLCFTSTTNFWEEKPFKSSPLICSDSFH